MGVAAGGAAAVVGVAAGGAAAVDKLLLTEGEETYTRKLTVKDVKYIVKDGQ